MLHPTEVDLPPCLARLRHEAGMNAVQSKNLGIVCVQSVGCDTMIRCYGSFASSAQNSDLLYLLTWDLHGFDFDIIAHTKLINGDELIAAFQPCPWFDGQGHFTPAALPSTE